VQTKEAVPETDETETEIEPSSDECDDQLAAPSPSPSPSVPLAIWLGKRPAMLLSVLSLLVALRPIASQADEGRPPCGSLSSLSSASNPPSSSYDRKDETSEKACSASAESEFELPADDGPPDGQPPSPPLALVLALLMPLLSKDDVRSAAEDDDDDDDSKGWPPPSGS
jgi:hypothetical protein